MWALSGVGLIASLVTKGYSLDQEHKLLQGLDQGNHPEDLEAKGTAA